MFEPRPFDCAVVGGRQPFALADGSFQPATVEQVLNSILCRIHEQFRLNSRKSHWKGNSGVKKPTYRPGGPLADVALEAVNKLVLAYSTFMASARPNSDRICRSSAATLFAESREAVIAAFGNPARLGPRRPINGRYLRDITPTILRTFLDRRSPNLTCKFVRRFHAKVISWHRDKTRLCLRKRTERRLKDVGKS